MKAVIAAFVASLIFGLGLGLSGMTMPSKVIGFLDIMGKWDPSLILVMIGATLIHAISYRIITKRQSPILASNFQIPTRRDFDWKLILGSAIFGAGWGLAGFCPGPALVSLVAGDASAVIFVISMVAGIYLYNFFDKKFLHGRGR